MKTKSNSPSSAADRLERRADVHRHAVGVAGALEVAARDRGVLFGDLAAVDAPALRQPGSHRERPVARVRAELEHALRREAVDEQLEEAALDRSREHLRRAKRRARLLGELGEQRLGRASCARRRTPRSRAATKSIAPFSQAGATRVPPRSAGSRPRDAHRRSVGSVNDTRGCGRCARSCC